MGHSFTCNTTSEHQFNIYAEFEIHGTTFRSEWNESNTINLYISTPENDWHACDCITDYNIKDHRHAAHIAIESILEESETQAEFNFEVVLA